MSEKAPATVKLSTGHVVEFNAVFSHKADRAYSRELSKGVQVVITQKGEDKDGKAINDVQAQTIPLENLENAYEAALPLVVKNVKDSQGTEVVADTEFFDNLPQKDFNRLKEAVRKMKEDADTDTEKAKK